MKKYFILISVLSFAFYAFSYKTEKKSIKTYQTEAENFKYHTGYTPYEVMVIYTRAHEGFRSRWYKDGIVSGKQSYSIGYGINDQGNAKRHRMIQNKYLDASDTITKAAATKAIVDFYSEHERYVPSSNIWAELAWKLHFYNRGTPKKLFACCGSQSGCGSKNKNIRASHNERRNFEKAIYERDYVLINSTINKCLNK